MFDIYGQNSFDEIKKFIDLAMKYNDDLFNFNISS